MENILKQIKPSKEESSTIKKLVKQISTKIKIKNTKVELGGSGAKETNLSDSHDIDIYVKFNPKYYKSEKISKILESKINKLKPIKLHGSRDYFQLKYKDYTVEIVPIIEIQKAEQAQNITDISPLHTKWVKKHHRLVDQIRLTKAFVKAHNCYGAESYIGGLSGYVLEILTINSGSFNQFIKDISKYKLKTVIDYNKLIKNPYQHLNNSKLHSPIIVIDPVDKTRNAAAALTKEKFHLLQKACKNYLKNPTEKAFIKKQITIPKDVNILEITPSQGKKDVIGSKLLKSFNFLKKQIELEGYKLKKSGWLWETKAYFWFKVDKEKLSETIIKSGPFIKDQKNIIKFKKVNKNIYKKGNRYYSKIYRKHKNFKEFLKNLIKCTNLKDKIRKIQFISK